MNAPWSWAAVVFLHAAYALSFIDRLVIGLLVPSIKASLRLSDVQMGLLMGRRRDLLRSSQGGFLIAQRMILLQQSVLQTKNLSVFF